MLILHGKAALSYFRIEKLLHKLRADVPDIHAIGSQFMHFVDIKQRPDNQQMMVLERIPMHGASEDQAGYQSNSVYRVGFFLNEGDNLYIQ